MGGDMSSYNDKSGQCSGDARLGILRVWVKHISRKEYCAQTTIKEIDRLLGIHGNSYYAIRMLAKQIMEAETDRWIADTADPELRALRRRYEDTDPDLGRLSTAHQLQIDSAARVLRKLYEAEIGHPPISWYERVMALNH
jgi:arsenate reductase-like glutaredoxin family protein